MAERLTPTEMGRRFAMLRREVIAKCMERGVTIFQGRIDVEEFETALGGPKPITEDRPDNRERGE